MARIDLDPVVVEFLARTDEFVAAVEAAQHAVEGLRDDVRGAIGDIILLQRALDSLPDEKVIRVRYDADQPPAGVAFGDAAAAAAQAEALRTVQAAAYDDAAAQAANAAATSQSADAAEQAARTEYLLAMAERMRANSAREAAGAEFDQTAVTLASIDATLAAARAQIIYGQAMQVVNGEVDANREALAKQAAAAEAARVAALTSSGGGGGIFGFLGAKFPLFGGTLGTGAMGAVAGWHIALDAAFESAIALTGAIAALSIGLAAMAPAARDIYNHLVAVHDVSVALGQTIPPLNGWFEQIQHQMASQTVEAYGGALNLINHNMGGLSVIVGEVVHGIDDWIARLDLWSAGQHGINGILQAGVGFLSQFRVIVDDVGVAIGNLVKDDPGTVHFLLDFVEGASKLLDVITSLPTPIVMGGLALHSFWLWGGLAATQAVRMLGPLRAMALGMGDVAAAETAVTAAGKDATGFQFLKATVADIGTGFAAWGRNIGTAVSEAEGAGKIGAGLGAAFSFVNPAVLGVAALAAGIGYLTYEMMQSSKASQQFAASVNQAFAQDSATKFLGEYPQMAAQAMSGFTAAAQQQTDAFKPWEIAIHNTARSFVDADFPAMFGNAAKAVGDLFAGMVHAQQAGNSASNYAGALATLNQGQKNLLQDADLLISKGHGVAQSFALMDVAGVTASDSLALADQKVKNLITGYANMGVQGQVLSGAVAAVTFATEQQASKVQALTQAYSTWFSTITGGVSSFATFAQQTIGLYQSLSGGAVRLADSNGKVSLSMQGLAAQAGSTTVSMTGLNTASLNAQQTFIQSASAAQTQFNSLLTLSSAAGLGQRGTQMLTGAMKDYMAILMPAAGNNKALQQTLISMFQEIDPNIKTWGQLATAVGNVKNPMQNLQNTTTAFTVAAGSLTQDVNNLAEAIGQTLNQAMAQALLQANGGQTAFDNFANALSNAHTTSKQLHDSAQQLAEKLLSVYGNTATAENEFIVMATAMGISKGAAQQLWNSVESGAAAADASVHYHVNSIIGALASIPSMKTIVFNYEAIGSTAAPTGPYSSGYVMPGSSHLQAMTGATGMRVPGGYGGGDVVPAWLEPGEAVVPKHLVPYVAPFLGAHHVPGFAEGGIPWHGAGGHGGPYRKPWNMSDVASLWAAEIWSQDLHRYGRNSPIGLKEMQAILAASEPGKGFLPRTALAGLLGRDERHDFGGYMANDLKYWQEAAALAANRKSEANWYRYIRGIEFRDLAHWDFAGFTREEAFLQALMTGDARKQIGLGMSMNFLAGEMGYNRGGMVRSYDAGGYLPVGLSMAYNGTGRPEPVGGAAHSTRPLVNRIELDGRVIAEQLTEHLVATVNDYGYLNSGRPTGNLIPGG